MAEYSTNYTQNTTSYTFGTETYKFSRTVDVINPSAIDNSCIYCGAENGSMYDYYPTYMLGTAEKAIMNNKWSASGGTFNFQKSATATPYNITFVKCGETGTADERGRNTVYQIGKTIYNKASSDSNSSMRVLNPTDIRKLIFSPRFNGYTASPSSTFDTVDLKYLMDHPDDFFVQQMTMNVYAWNGSMFTNDNEIQSIRPCIVGENYFIPVNNVLGRHIFGMTNYNTQRDYTQSFFGTYDKDNMPMSYVPILTDETLTYNPGGSSGGGATSNHNKWKWSYNSYNSTYEIHAPARQVLQLMAFCGCYFVDSSYSTSGKNLNTFWNDPHIYLGEMKSGARTTGVFIKGTDLLTSDTINKGEYSSQTDFNPSPPGPGPYDDDPWSGVSFSGVAVGGAGAFARCYYMTSTELQNLRTWMSGVGVPEGFDPMLQIIGLSQVPVALSGDAPETVQFINSSAVYDPGVVSRVVDSGVSTQYSMGKPISYSLGNIDIARRMQERGEPYLDYSCQIELYLPLIGTFALDTQAVMGRTLEAQAILDPIAGTLAAYAWVTRDGQKLPVAYGSTTIGIDLPITAQQYSMSRAAAKQINAQFTASMLSSALTTVTAAAAAGSASSAAAGRAGAASGAGIQPASQLNAYAQSASIAGSQTAISQSGNIFGAFMEWGRAIRQLSYGNNTAIAGSFGGSMAQWSYPFNAYVKIIRPRYEKPSNYNHTQGVPCVQTKTIGSCTGLIQCIGADVSGITRATDLERQAIQAALCNGVYAGGGE